MIREQSELGTKIIFVTHDINQAFRLANDAVMYIKVKLLSMEVWKVSFKSQVQVSQSDIFLDLCYAKLE